MSRLRIVSVPYLNAAPLVWGFRHGSLRSRIDLSVARPSHIAGLLERGEADFGLLPIIETQRLDGCRTIGGCGIVSPRRARSVLLVSRGPLAQIRRIAVDTSSRTSAALLRVVLAAQGLDGCAFAEAEPDFPAMLEGRDAALLIGDPALGADTRGFEVLDLAEAWHAETGLPFVFAAWTARPGLALPDEVIDVFETSRREGIERLEAIARQASAELGLPAGDLERYLSENIRFDVGPEEERAVSLFLMRAHETGLIGPPRPVVWSRPAAPRSARIAAGLAVRPAGVPGSKHP